MVLLLMLTNMPLYLDENYSRKIDLYLFISITTFNYHFKTIFMNLLLIKITFDIVLVCKNDRGVTNQIKPN